MEPSGEERLWERLEQNGPLLEDASRAEARVVRALQSWRWRAALVGAQVELRERIRARAEVAHALAAATRRCATEGWPPTATATVRLQRVLHQAQALRRWAHHRLGGANRSSADWCLALEEQVVLAPRHVTRANAWVHVEALLPPGLPELDDARGLGEALAGLCGRPERAQRAPPVSEAEALFAPLARLTRADPQGLLAQAVWSRSRVYPGPMPRPGAAQLVYALFWYRWAAAHLGWR